MGTIHAADPAKSRRLEKVLILLRANKKCGVTTLQIDREAGTVAASTCISELRRGPGKYHIERRRQGNTEEGAQVHRYWLIEPGDPMPLALQNVLERPLKTIEPFRGKANASPLLAIQNAIPVKTENLNMALCQAEFFARPAWGIER